jgi:hypothetical protein
MAWTPLKVVTTNFRAGWLRANGVPYSAGAVITEHFMRYAVPDAGEWLTVRTVVDDPRYLVQPFMTSTNFKKEADGSKWSPKACSGAWRIVRRPDVAAVQTAFATAILFATRPAATMI